MSGGHNSRDPLRQEVGHRSGVYFAQQIEQLCFSGDQGLMAFRFCVVFLLSVPPLVYAQQNPRPLDLPSEVDASSRPDPSQGLIRLDVVVSDKSGKPVAGLKQQDFTLLDNGQPGKIVSFQAFDGATARPDPPVEVILVIDELNLPDIRQLATKQRAHASLEGEAENFLRQNHGQLAQPTLIYILTDNGLSASVRPTTDGNALADEIAHRRAHRTIWKTPMVSEDVGKVDSEPGQKVVHSLIALGSIAIEERRRPGRKVMFWMGSGWLTEGSGVGRLFGPLFDLSTELSTRLREARIELWGATEWPFYDAHGNPIPANNFVFKDFLQSIKPGWIDFSYLALPAIAIRTGGGALRVSNDLSGAISKQAERAGAFYSLTFDPRCTDEVDEYHALKVDVGNPDLTVHARTGYFDEPVFYDQSPSGIEHVTVAQLENALRRGATSSGTEMARQLSHMQLTERLSTARLAILKSTLKNRNAREALIALADESSFLLPPSGEIPATAPPDSATQQQIIARAIQYVDTTTRRLPNLFADRFTIQYHQRPPSPGQTWKTMAGDQSLYQDETSKATVTFHNGKETANGEVTKTKLLNQPEMPVMRLKNSVPEAEDSRQVSYMETVGTFGAVLTTVIVGASEKGSEFAWSRWEQGANGPLAVFRYRVPRETPLFLVQSDFLTIDDRTASFQKKARYHGEFTVDPASGEIYRLTIEADLEERLPLQRSAVMVEYAPTVIGGITYICPVRSVSISRSRTTMDIHEWAEHFKVYAPFETKLSDMTYEKYHLYHPTSRMLPGFTPAPNQ